MPPKGLAAVVLAECHAAGLTGVFIMSDHAVDRAEERKISRKDVRHALSGAATATQQENGRWEIVGGVDLEGTAVTLIVKVMSGLLVVTLF